MSKAKILLTDTYSKEDENSVNKLGNVFGIPPPTTPFSPDQKALYFVVYRLHVIKALHENIFAYLCRTENSEI